MQYIDEKERNNYLEVDTSGDKAKLTIWHWTSFEEIELTQNQIKDLMKELGNWLEFKEAAEYIFKKNDELYRRLAQND